MPTKKITFGLELEASEISPTAAGLMSRHQFKRQYDRSIRQRTGEEIAREVCGELISKVIVATFNISTGARDAPVVVLEQNTAWTVVRDLCKCASKVNPTCGMHVHVGKPRGNSGADLEISHWSDQELHAWILTGILLENKLYNVVPASRMNNQYCQRMADIFSVSELAYPSPLGTVLPSKYHNPKRYGWLNLVEARRIPSGQTRPRGTVEIRMLGNTRRVDYVWAWVKLWLKVAAVIAYHDPLHATTALAFSDLLSPEFDEINRIRAQARGRASVPPNIAGDNASNFMTPSTGLEAVIPPREDADADYTTEDERSRPARAAFARPGSDLR